METCGRSEAPPGAALSSGSEGSHGKHSRATLGHMSAPAVGTRLRCAQCGTEIIVVKAPTGPLSCCGAEMGAREQQGSESAQ
jgi:hypothetical protein